MDTLFQNFWAISQKVQTLQNQAEKKEVDPKERVRLHRELESLQDSLEDLKASATQTESHALSQFEEMESQIISLYRIVEERFEKFEIQQISKKALDLSNALESGKMIKVAKKCNELRHNILFLFKHRAPSMNERKVLLLATKMADEASHMLTCNNAKHEHVQFIQLLRYLLREALEKSEKMVSLDEAELAMEFYEIADMLHQRRNNEAKLRLHLMRGRLSKEQKDAIDSSTNLVETLLSLAGSEEREISYQVLTEQSV